MTRLPLLVTVAVLLGAGSALAQDAGGQTPPEGPGAGMQHPGMAPEMGRHGYMGMRRHRMEMMTKAASFHFRREGAAIDIRCAADEPTKACVDAAGVLIDKLVATAPK